MDRDSAIKFDNECNIGTNFDSGELAEVRMWVSILHYKEIISCTVTTLKLSPALLLSSVVVVVED